ncbi:MAG: winged helix-turn-helix domain-containing protein [Motiliproteus sp.]|nr:winged helix-turn-helix domain-containing protein [Motiliproteus sp.]MCW9051792.1 winged helix-turn-helix domain-containing protein [Motiliproteus sp.]
MNPTFCRRLLICHLISTEDRPSVPHLIEATGWPRRTIQDIIKALPGMGIDLHFQQDGKRNNDGYYVLENWGPIDRSWVKTEIQKIRDAIES